MKKRIWSLNLAALAILKGHKDYKIQYDYDSKKYYFVFEDDLEELIKEYRTNDIFINLKEYTRVFKDLKIQLHRMEI